MINIKEFLGLAYYTSSLDQFLAEFNKKHSYLSASQRKEIAKYDDIYEMRDYPVDFKAPKKVWDKF